MYLLFGCVLNFSRINHCWICFKYNVAAFNLKHFKIGYQLKLGKDFERNFPGVISYAKIRFNGIMYVDKSIKYRINGVSNQLCKSYVLTF